MALAVELCQKAAPECRAGNAMKVFVLGVVLIALVTGLVLIEIRYASKEECTPIEIGHVLKTGC
jgi:hypothetical protein